MERRDGPRRTFANPLIAEAVELARKRDQQASAEQPIAAPVGRSELPNDSPGASKPARSRWLDDDEDTQVAQRPKRRHSPIVWPSQSKAAKTTPEGRPGSSASGGYNVGPGLTMAERAQAELEAFKRHQAELAGGVGEEGELPQRPQRIDPTAFMKGSPEVSSPEEEMHIRREGNSAHALATSNGTPMPGAEPEPDDSEGLGGYEGPQPAPASGDDVLEAYPEVSGGSDDDRERAGRYSSGEEDGRRARSRGHEEADGVGDGHGGMDNGEEASGVLVAPKKRQMSMLNECRSVENYEKLNRISEGTYGVVYRARDKETGEICALKKVKLEKERDGFPLTSVREINILLSLAHPSIVNVSEVVVGSSMDSVFMVMEYADHDLKGVMERRMNQPFSTAEVKCLMLQLLSGVAYLHHNWVIHRDLKTSNILYTNRGQLKICDFGLARQYGEPLKPYTHLVVTLWYRSPELLLGQREYSTPVDVWSCGCIMAELLAKAPLFPGQNEVGQLDQIFKTLGVPNEDTWSGVTQLPNFRRFNFKGSSKSVLRGKFPPPGPVFDGRPTLSDAGFDLLKGLLDMCPERRMSAQEALDHPWFREHPLPKDPAMMPTFPGTNEALHGAAHR